MRIAIRADASVAIGTGHVMRCLALAEAMRARGAEIAFISREAEGNLCRLVQERGFGMFRLPDSGDVKSAWQEDADRTVEVLDAVWAHTEWIIVDHYHLDAKWEHAVRGTECKIMAIDDLADRPHDCDVLLDQNFVRDMERRYQGLVSGQTRLLLGPMHALLRQEFLQARMTRRQRAGSLQRMLFFFGGSDPTNETGKALEGLKQFNRPDIAVDVVIGASNPHRDDVKRQCEALPNVRLHCQVDNMAALMAAADLALGAGGVSTWERCCVGLPALVSILADNQAELTLAAAEYGAIVNLGRGETLSADDYKRALETVDAAQLARMEERGLALVDGMGCERVMEALES